MFVPNQLIHRFRSLPKAPKDGFFIEAGFETGLLQGTQTQEQTIATTQEKPKPKPKPKPITLKAPMGNTTYPKAPF